MTNENCVNELAMLTDALKNTKCQKRQTVALRMAVAHKLVREYRRTFIEVGEIIGRNHSTISHYEKKWNDYIETNDELLLWAIAVVDNGWQMVIEHEGLAVEQNITNITYDN